MFSIDDRAGNVLTTVALFLVLATTLYAARRALFILLLSLLFAYLLEADELTKIPSERLETNSRWVKCQETKRNNAVLSLDIIGTREWVDAFRSTSTISAEHNNCRMKGTAPTSPATV